MDTWRRAWSYMWMHDNEKDAIDPLVAELRRLSYAL
jgi:hypothetical protein